MDGIWTPELADDATPAVVLDATVGAARVEKIETWTPERIEQLTRLWEEGVTTAEIGRRIGVTKNAVIGKVHRIGLVPRVVKEAPVPQPISSIRAPPPRASQRRSASRSGRSACRRITAAAPPNNTST